MAAEAGTIVTGVETTETKLVSEHPIEMTVDGFGNNCLVDDALLLSCEDRALLLVFDKGVPGRMGEALPESLHAVETIGNATTMASSSSSSSLKSSVSLSALSMSSTLLSKLSSSS